MIHAHVAVFKGEGDPNPSADVLMECTSWPGDDEDAPRIHEVGFTLPDKRRVYLRFRLADLVAECVEPR